MTTWPNTNTTKKSISLTDQLVIIPSNIAKAICIAPIVTANSIRASSITSVYQLLIIVSPLNIIIVNNYRKTTHSWYAIELACKFTKTSSFFEKIDFWDPEVINNHILNNTHVLFVDTIMLNQRSASVIYFTINEHHTQKSLRIMLWP